MTEPQPATPAQPAQPAGIQGAQLGLGLVDTPAGQRLAVQLIVLLTAAEAKQLAEGIAGIASSMSSSGLVVAIGPITSMQVSGMPQNGQSPSK